MCGCPTQLMEGGDMGIIIDDREFDPSLRNRIAAFIDALFEEPDLGEEASFGAPEPMRAAGAARSSGEGGTYGTARLRDAYEPDGAAWSSESAGSSGPSEPSGSARYSGPPKSSRFSRGNMADAFGRFFESLSESREEKAARSSPRDEEADFVSAAAMPCEEPSASYAAPALPREDVIAAPDAQASFTGAMPCPTPPSLESWLDQVDEPFSTTLLSLIDRKGLADVDVYKRAHMSRQLFSRIRSDASYRPAKKTVLALAIAMGLSLEETRDLLERAGFALSRSSKRDLIVEYFVSNDIYDLFAINEALYEFDQPLI